MIEKNPSKVRMDYRIIWKSFERLDVDKDWLFQWDIRCVDTYET